MRSRLPVRVGADRPTEGPASVVQGAYGSRGNLELVVPDAVDGLWVFWFNSDLPEDPPQSPDVPAGAWSAGLAFARGARYREAVVLQSSLGPDHLEVLALRVDGDVESWWWSPGPGFQRRGGVVATGISRLAAEHDAGELRATLVDASGARRRVASPAEGHPDRRWVEVAPTDAPGPPLPDEAEALAALRALGVAAVDPGTARLARSDRDGGTAELTWRTRGELHHAGAPIGSRVS